MPLHDPLTVIVHVSQDEPLGAAMNRMRSWLDGQKIETTAFATKADSSGHTFTIGFESSADADRFQHQFDAVNSSYSAYAHS